MKFRVDVIGTWEDTAYQLGSVKTTAAGMLVSYGTEGEHDLYPLSGDRHRKNPRSGNSTWYPREVQLSDVTAERPLSAFTFDADEPPHYAVPYRGKPSDDSYTFQGDAGGGVVRLAVVGVGEINSVDSAGRENVHMFTEIKPAMAVWTERSDTAYRP
jgi:hypothetical protein